MDQVIAVSQRIVRAVYVRDAKEDAEVAKDKRRKLPPHCIIVIRQYRQYVCVPCTMDLFSKLQL